MSDFDYIFDYLDPDSTLDMALAIGFIMGALWATSFFDDDEDE